MLTEFAFQGFYFRFAFLNKIVQRPNQFIYLRIQIKKMKQLLPLAIFALIVFSCKKEKTPTPDPDTTVPNLTLSEPTNEAVYYCGSDIRFEATATDENGLKEMKVSIGSSHTELNKLTFNSTDALSGKSQTLTKNISIPVDAAVGNYTLSAFCSDTANNNSPTLTRTFTVKDTIKPTLTHFQNIPVSLTDALLFTATVNSKNLLNSITVKKAGTNDILATIGDNLGIKEVRCQILDGGKVYQIKSMKFNASQLQDTWSYNYPNPNKPNPSIVIQVYDTENNYKQFSIPIP